ncbi:RNA dependent RNA polymerase-domain-containing protein [Gigaspora rosea]|uniref:RNA-dependent RNA polymerase n=1 Tax=Gigaspora rosea TaxID=44941 RepID=A0A397VAL6_9GLOM|nr:RNA dependent RNA polymerase-domain-containing protein [Gigaspora rosea]
MATRPNSNSRYDNSINSNSYSYSISNANLSSYDNNSFNEVVNELKRKVEKLMSRYRIGESFITSSHEFYMEDLSVKNVKCLDDLINEFFKKSMPPDQSIGKDVFQRLQVNFEQELHQKFTSLFDENDENWNDDLYINGFSNNNTFSMNVETPLNFVNDHSPTDFWIPKGKKNSSTKIPYEYESYLLGYPFLVWYEVVRLFQPFGPIKYSINVLNKLNNCKTAFDFYDAFESICKDYLRDSNSNRDINGQDLRKLIPYNRLLWEVQETNKSIGKRKHINYSGEITMRNGKLELDLNAPKTCQSKRYFRMFSAERFFHLKINKDIQIEKLDEKKCFLLKKLLLHPLELAGRTYEFLYAKEGTLYYFATKGSCLNKSISILDAINCDVAIYCNLDMTTAKFYSRISLGFSDSIPAIVFGPDQINYDKPDVENIIGKCLTDGCAPISLAAMREIAKVMDHRETPQFIQARIGGAKGIWFLEHQVRDPYKLSIDLRQSQSKYKLDFKFDNPFLRTLDLVRIIKSPDRPATLNAQLIRILEHGGVPMQVFIDMIKENVQKIKDMVIGQDDPTVLRAWIAKSGNVMRRRIEDRINHNDSNDVNDYGSNCSEISTNSGSGGVSLSGYPDSMSEIAIEMLDAGFTPSTCPFLAKKIKQLLKGQLSNLSSKFHIENSQSRYLICVADPSNSLKEGEIFIQLDGDAGYDERGMRFGIVEGDVILSRNPCALPSDIQKVRAVNNPLLCKYYNVVIFPVDSESRDGPLAAKLSGGDYDGDKVFCCWDPRITELYQNSPVAETLPEVENAFSKCTETIGNYLAPVKNDAKELTKKVQRLILEEYFKDILTPVGMYDYYHRLYSSHHGLSDPKSIYLAQIGARLLDATKQGEKLKDSVFKSDRKYNNLPIPFWMEKDKSKSKTKSVCSMDNLRRIAQEEVAFVNSPEFSVSLNTRRGLDPHIHQFWLREFERATNMNDDGRYKKDLELIISVTASIIRKYNSEIRQLLGEEDLSLELQNSPTPSAPTPNSIYSRNGKIRSLSYKYTEQFINFPLTKNYESDILKHVDRTDLNYDITLFELRLKAAALYIQSFTRNPEYEVCWKLAFRILCGLKARIIESEKSDIVGGPRSVTYEVWQSLNVDNRWRNV